MPTATDIFSDINSRLQSDPGKTAGMSAVYAFDLSGEDGGQYFIKIVDGKAEVGPGSVADASVTISMSSDNFVELATGKLDATMAFMTGKLKVKGDMGKAMKLQSLLR